MNILQRTEDTDGQQQKFKKGFHSYVHYRTYEQALTFWSFHPITYSICISDLLQR